MVHVDRVLLCLWITTKAYQPRDGSSSSSSDDGEDEHTAMRQQRRDSHDIAPLSLDVPTSCALMSRCPPLLFAAALSGLTVSGLAISAPQFKE